MRTTGSASDSIDELREESEIRNVIREAIVSAVDMFVGALYTSLLPRVAGMSPAGRLEQHTYASLPIR
jgi:hypothetical protein